MTPAATPATPAPPRDIDVWLVEDHDTFRRSLQRLCAGEPGIRCSQSFSQAESMLERLGSMKGDGRPDVVLLDLGLPGMSGLDVIGEVLALAGDCRVIILTVFEDEAKISRAINAGACGYLLKTARPEEIIRAIREGYEGGAPMSPRIARSVIELLARLSKPVAPVEVSPREKEILALLVEGLTAKEISARLGVSIHTADTHTRNLYAKLGVRNRAAAVARAMRSGMIGR